MARYRKRGSFVYVKDKEILKKSFCSFLPCQVFKVTGHQKSGSESYVWVDSMSQGLPPKSCKTATKEQIKQYKKEKKKGLYLSYKNGYTLDALEGLFNMFELPKLKKNKIEKVQLDHLDDFTGSLEKLKNEIDILIKKYGKNSIIKTNAGYNNVSFELEFKKQLIK